MLESWSSLDLRTAAAIRFERVYCVIVRNLLRSSNNYSQFVKQIGKIDSVEVNEVD